MPSAAWLVALAALLSLHAVGTAAQYSIVPCADYVCSNLTMPFCIVMSTVPGSLFCKPCNPDDYTQQNCDCPVDQYCARGVVLTGRFTRGLCTPYTLTGKACTTNSDCVTQSLDTSGGQQDEEVQYCVQGVCRPCSGAASPIFAAPIQCQGWSNGQLLTSQPGLYRQCQASGFLTSSGTIDYSLGLVSPSRTPTASLSHGAQPSSTPTASRTATASLSHGASPSTTPSLGSQQTTGKVKKASDAALVAVPLAMLLLAVLLY